MLYEIAYFVVIAFKSLRKEEIDFYYITSPNPVMKIKKKQYKI